MPCSVQIAEDRNGNLLHLLSEVLDGKATNTTVFVHTDGGVQSASTGTQLLKGDVRHRFTGTYDGTKEEYIRAAHNSGYNGFFRRRTLEKMGVDNLTKGMGAVVDAATLGATVLNGAQIVHLWNTFSADGILTQEELVRLGVEIIEVQGVGDAVGEIKTAVTEDGVNVLAAAEEQDDADGFLNDGIDAVQEAGESASEGLKEFGVFIVEVLGELFS